LEELLLIKTQKFFKRTDGRVETLGSLYCEKNSTPLAQSEISELAKKLEEYSIYKGATHRLDFTAATLGDESKNEGFAPGGPTGKATVNADPSKIKSILYNLETGAGATAVSVRVFKTRIDETLTLLKSLYN